MYEVNPRTSVNTRVRETRFGSWLAFEGAERARGDVLRELEALMQPSDHRVHRAGQGTDLVVAFDLDPSLEISRRHLRAESPDRLHGFQNDAPQEGPDDQREDRDHHEEPGARAADGERLRLDDPASRRS